MSRYACYIAALITGVGSALSGRLTLALELISIALVAYVFYQLITNRENPFPIGELALFMGGIQWLVAPIISYNSAPAVYPMAVAENTYLIYTLILYIPFCYAIMRSLRSYRPKLQRDILTAYCKRQRSSIFFMYGVGLLSFLSPTQIPGLGLISTLISGLFYIGSIMLCFAYPFRAIAICGCTLAILLLRSISGGMFHELTLWGIILTFVIFYLRGYSTKRRIVIILALFMICSTLQTIKPLYRELTWYTSYNGNKVELFVSLFYDSLTGRLSSSESGDFYTRINQGWIISRIYKRIPAQQDYVGGKTITEALEAALVPRFLAPDKKDSGKDSIRDFENFTGYRLQSNTSMGLSILGEAYGNYGLSGGALLMFLWGYMVVFLVRAMESLSRFLLSLYFMIPLVSLNLIKAEINFLSMINWAVKAFCFSIIIAFLFRFYTKKKI